MVFDRNENEPEEWDPEEEFYDPDSDGLTIPQVSTGDDGPDDPGDLSSAIEPPAVSTAETDVPDDVLQTFWTLVLVINAAVLILSLGLLVLAFEGDLTRGGVLVVAGLVLFGLAGRRYRRFRDDGADTESDATTGHDTTTERNAATEHDTAVDDGSGDNADGPGDNAETAGRTVEDPAETTSRDVTQRQSSNRDHRS
ncbi:DUF7322 domain-containing protein [Natrinema soli]|uniref:DUF7322 domain-containing protein n=1 Tax=Natrinema soli TaxID=1930624 RepID=A0ABD5STU7_9EURY|nr:hypothetical protein [Natrinema soli]